MNWMWARNSSGFHELIWYSPVPRGACIISMNFIVVLLPRRSHALERRLELREIELRIPIIACIARPDFALSLSESIPPSCFGTICQDTPNLSTSQPHCTSLPPFSVSPFQRRSISACVSTCTMSEKPWEKVNVGPPLSAIVRLPEELERHREDGALRLRPSGRVAHRLLDPPVEEHGVELRGLFGLGVVREEGGDRGRHGRSPWTRPGLSRRHPQVGAAGPPSTCPVRFLSPVPEGHPISWSLERAEILGGTLEIDVRLVD